VGVVVIGCVEYVCVQLSNKKMTNASMTAVFVSFSRKNLPNMDDFIDQHPPAKIIFKKNQPKTIIYILEIALVIAQVPFHILSKVFDSGLEKCKDKFVQNQLKELEIRFGVKTKCVSPYDQSKVLSVLHFWIDTFQIQSVYHNRNYVVSLLLEDVKNFSNLNVIDRPIARKIDDYIPFISYFWVYRRNEANFRQHLNLCYNHSDTSPNSDCAIYRAFVITCLSREHDDFLNELLLAE
jgi:hypothetical protein